MVDFLIGSTRGEAVDARLGDHDAHVPSHFDAEILSAIGRLHRAGEIPVERARACLERLSEAPIARHPLPPLILGAWRRRSQLRLADALYVELAEQLEAIVVTTDAGMAAAEPRAELVSTI